MLRSAHILQLAALALLGVGVIMVPSAALRVGPDVNLSSPGAVLGSRQMMYALIAALVMFAASRVNVRQLFRSRGWANPLWFVLLLSLGLVALTLVPGFGHAVNGASRWLSLGPKSWGFTFQPSELVKWVMVIAVAWWCARRGGVMHLFWSGLLPALILLAVACTMVVVEDLGTAALIAGVAASLLIAGGARWWHLAIMAPVGLLGLVAAVLHSPYRLTRLTSFLNPWADPAGAGYHPIQSMLAIVEGGLWGRGLGNGIQKFGYLPEDTTDFIFAIICEELGLAGAALVVGLYLTILWVGLGIVRDCRDTFGRLVGLGVLLTLGLQATINIAVVTVVVPTKGIALPLISSGGTGWIMTAFALGLLAALDNANALHDHGEQDLLLPQTDEPAQPSLA